MYGVLRVTIDESWRSSWRMGNNIMPPSFKREFVKLPGQDYPLSYGTEEEAQKMAASMTDFARGEGILNVGYRARRID